MSRKANRVYSQLIVIDFNRAERYPDFKDLSGFTNDTVEWYRNDLFELFAAHLFNYERWGNRPMLELVFQFTPEYNFQAKLDEKTSYDQAIDEIVAEIIKKYEAKAKLQIAVISNRDRLTICGFSSTEKYPDIGRSLTWLVEPIEEKDNAEPSSNEDRAEPPSTA